MTQCMTLPNRMCLHEEWKREYRALLRLLVESFTNAGIGEREREKVLLLSTALGGKSDGGNLAGDVRSVRAGHHMNVGSKHQFPRVGRERGCHYMTMIRMRCWVLARYTCI